MNEITGTPEDPAFPVIKKPRVSQISFLRILLFLVVVFDAALAVIRYEFPDAGILTALLFFASVCGYIDVWFAMTMRNNIIKLINWQVYIAMVICIIVSFYTHTYLWLYGWALPGMFLFNALSTVAVALISRISPNYCILYIVFDIALSFLQIIPVANGLNPFPLPAVISMAAMFVLLAAILIFMRRELSSASHKWFNI